ncbi:Helix-turn-helix domain protein [compost metagenome]
MTHTTQPNRRIHEGRNVKRFREMLGIKQDALAADLGGDWNQQRVSQLEQRDVIDDAILNKIATILKVPVETIRNYDEEQAVNMMTNTFNNVANNSGNNTLSYLDCSFNPIDKMVELYERLLQQQKEMMDKMEQVINKK